MPPSVAPFPGVVPGAHLPRIVELKRTLSGRETQFECRVLHGEGPHLVVLFVSAEAMRVHGVDLPPRTVTFGHFWQDRPYNVYHWLDGSGGRAIGAYVNLAAETHIEPGRVEWLDLAVDILALPGAPPRVLDEHEIPADATPALRAKISEACRAVLDGMPDLLTELERFRGRLWPLVAPREAVETVTP
jgi:hypothetical protein